jgi:hypothetical protein
MTSDVADAAPLHYHGTRADLKPGDLIAPGYSSNYGERKQASWVYLTGGTMPSMVEGPRWPSSTRRRHG